MSADAVLALAALAGVGGVAVLRAAWSRPQRSFILVTLGWGLLLASLVLGAISGGAWGCAVASLWAMGAAFAALAWAAISSPPGKGQASNRRVGMLPGRGEPRRIGGRLLTFALVAVVSALLAIGAALAVGALARAAGWSAANANAMLLFTMPLAWSVIAYAVLVQATRKGQFKALALASLPTWPALALGLLT
ncbi:hypothetical protein [Novosphingobium soli]|uniref:Uncharacterized protein n=1 Tax=Novosphingobium soli TaxID=574956 RepID=A0ABV6CSZ7_9SPHN